MAWLDRLLRYRGGNILGGIYTYTHSLTQSEERHRIWREKWLAFHRHSARLDSSFTRSKEKSVGLISWQSGARAYLWLIWLKSESPIQLLKNSPVSYSSGEYWSSSRKNDNNNNNFDLFDLMVIFLCHANRVWMAEVVWRRHQGRR